MVAFECWRNSERRWIPRNPVAPVKKIWGGVLTDESVVKAESDLDRSILINSSGSLISESQSAEAELADEEASGDSISRMRSARVFENK